VQARRRSRSRSPAPSLAARYRPGWLDPQLAGSLQDINDASFALTSFPLVVLLATFAIVAVSSSALPGWLGWIAEVISAPLLFGGLALIGNPAFEWAVFAILPFPFCLIPTSVVLMLPSCSRRPGLAILDAPEALWLDRVSKAPAYMDRAATAYTNSNTRISAILQR
jgi:hypothetical protein